MFTPVIGSLENIFHIKEIVLCNTIFKKFNK